MDTPLNKKRGNSTKTRFSNSCMKPGVSTFLTKKGSNYADKRHLVLTYSTILSNMIKLFQMVIELPA